MRTKLFLLTLLSVFMAISFAYAAGTPAGTVITNQATGEYKDANGNAMASVTSNEVTTTVTQVAGVDVSPASSSSNMASGGTASFPLTVTNTGNGSDTFDLTQVDVETGGGNNTVEIYYDADGDGVVDGGETTVSATSALAADAEYDIIVLVTNVSGADGSYTTVTLTATSQFNGSVSDNSTLTATVSASDLVVTMTVDNASPQPGDIVTYTITGQNNGSASADDVLFSAPIPTNTTYVPGSLRITTASRTDADDADSSDYNVTTSGAVTLNYGDIAASASGYVTFQVQIDAGVASGTTITPSATADFTGNGTPVDAGTGSAEITVAQSYAVTVGVDGSTNADPSDAVVYAVTVTNSGNGSDSFGLTTSDDSTWTWTIYDDVNDNGVYDSGTDTEITNTGAMAQSAVLNVLVRALVPAGTPDGAVNAMTLTATSVGDGSESDDGVYTVTVTAPVLALTKTVSPTGNQPPGTELTYTVSISNSGSGSATTIVITDAVPTNTTYVSESMKVGGAAKTDASDADGATLSGNSAVFEISSLSAGGSETVSFKTTIN
ncbi:MAG: DUF11 domain-containing protein [Candidatus Marinimicrobia bacterium]|nr:DUF11 domain-containing protein [Candidatus Neomarinimicrobiota bacterium]